MRFAVFVAESFDIPMNRRVDSIRDSEDSAENVRRLFASECAITLPKKLSLAKRRRCKSEPDTGYTVNYDDICGPWLVPENPFHAKQDGSAKPRICVWKFITPEIIAGIKRCLDDDTAMKRAIEKQLDDEDWFVNDDRKNIFLELVCSIIRFARDNRFTEEGTSALVGTFHLTYKFFLSNPWRTAEETYKFFRKTVLLHAVENPPESIEIFTPEQCKTSIELFTTLLLRHLPLVRFVCLPNYRCHVTLPKSN